MKTQMFVELAISPCQLGGEGMGANELQITEMLGSVEMDFSETVYFSVDQVANTCARMVQVAFQHCT